MAMLVYQRVKHPPASQCHHFESPQSSAPAQSVRDEILSRQERERERGLFGFFFRFFFQVECAIMMCVFSRFFCLPLYVFMI